MFCVESNCTADIVDATVAMMSHIAESVCARVNTHKDAIDMHCCNHTISYHVGTASSGWVYEVPRPFFDLES